MGLFNLLGADSPMFIPTNSKVDGFNIDYDKLLPALPNQQQVPTLAANDYSKLGVKWTQGDLQAQADREAQAKVYLQQAYNKSGGNFATLGNNPDFKHAQALMSINPLEVEAKNRNREMLDEFRKNVTDKNNPQGDLIDVDLYNNTGVKQTISKSIEQAEKTDSGQRNAGYSALDSLTKYGSETLGTQKDFNEGIEKLIGGITGTTSEELKSFKNEHFDKNGNIIPGTRDSLKSVGPHYGLVETLLSNTNNRAQIDAGATEILNGMDSRMKYALDNNFIRDMGYATDFSKYGDKAEDVRAIYNNYVVRTVRDYLNPKEKQSIKSEQTFQSIGDSLLDMKHRLGNKKSEEELTGPWTRAYQGTEAPSGSVKNNTVMLTNKDGKTTQFIPGVYDKDGKEHPLELGEWKGLAYSYSPGKTKIPADIVGNDVLFSGKENGIGALPKSAFVTNINSVQQVVDKNAQAYYSDAKPNQEITTEQAEELKKNNQLKFKKVVSLTAAIPYDEFVNGAGEQLQGYTNDDNQGKVASAYDFHLLGKDLEGNLADPDALKYGEVGGQKVVFVTYQTTPTAESLKQLDRLTHEGEKIKQELPEEQQEQ